MSPFCIYSIYSSISGLENKFVWIWSSCILARSLSMFLKVSTFDWFSTGKLYFLFFCSIIYSMEICKKKQKLQANFRGLEHFFYPFLLTWPEERKKGEKKNVCPYGCMGLLTLSSSGMPTAHGALHRGGGGCGRTGVGTIAAQALSGLRNGTTTTKRLSKACTNTLRILGCPWFGIAKAATFIV